ncbi:heme NO-binding domain-containing protein [Haloimpatiens sp. FM7315]|uniref:heme NO-binding domain-containing protein n=1 Tax=Haloimpatiens sp. FM7315 TaxID=3298609 RepID=UPI0035A277ED
MVATWLKTCRKLYNDEVVDKSMSSIGWDKNRIFSPIEKVDDGDIKKVIKK